MRADKAKWGIEKVDSDNSLDWRVPQSDLTLYLLQVRNTFWVDNIY